MGFQFKPFKPTKKAIISFSISFCHGLKQEDQGKRKARDEENRE
jgi:hypothetical protein